MLKRLFGPVQGPGHAVLRRNLIANIFDGGFYAFGMSLISIQTVMPVFVKRMGGDNVAVGLIPVLFTFGFNFPGIFVTHYLQFLPRKKPLFLKTAFAQRMPWLLLGFMTYLVIGHVSPAVAVTLFFILFLAAAVAGSINLPIWFDLLAKLTPVDLRGRLLAARNVIGGIFGILGGWIVERVLSLASYPANFAALFVLGVVPMMISYYFLTRLVEHEGPVPAQAVAKHEYFRTLPGILKREHNFRNYLIADALLIAATMAGAFYAVNGIEKFSLADSAVGFFTIVLAATMIVGNLFFGSLADRYGHKLNLMLGAGATVAGCAAALFAPSPALYVIAFVASALTTGLLGISRLSIVAELCTEEERPTYIALMNMITAPATLAGVAGGWIADRFGYDAVFGIAAVCALGSVYWLATKVVEPRSKGITPVVQNVQYEA